MQNLKVGDKFFVSSDGRYSYLHGPGTVFTVVKVTEKQFVAKSTRNETAEYKFNRETGFGIGNDHRAEELTEDRKNAILVWKRRQFVSNFKFDKLSDEDIKAIYDIIKGK